jgi:hypothetical protein
MTDIPELPHINIVHQLERTVSAHEAVHEGIATHAEKHRDAQHKAREAAAAARRLLAGAAAAHDHLPALPPGRRPGRPGALAGGDLSLALAAGECYGGRAGHHAGPCGRASA